MSDRDREHSMNNSAVRRESSLAGRVLIAFLLFIAAVSTVAYGAVDPPMQGILALLAAGVVLLWAVDAFSTGEFRLSAGGLQVPLIALIVLGFIQLLPFGDPGVQEGLLSVAPSAALTADPYATRWFIIRMVVYVAFFAAVLTYVDNATRIRIAVFFLIAFGALMAFYGVLQRLAAPDSIYGLRPTPQAIPFGSFVNQHHFAAFIVMVSGVVLALLFSRSLKRGILPLLVLAAVLMFLALAFTGSRGGFLSYLGMALAVFAGSRLFLNKETSETELQAGKRSKRRSAAVALAVSAGIISILVLVVFLGAGSGLIRGIGLDEPTGDPTSGRRQFWKVAAEIFFENPIIGTGLDSFAVVYSEKDPSSGQFRVEQTHNDYLQMLSDAGIAGFICVVAFIVVLVRLALKTLSSVDDPFSRAAALGAFAGCFGVIIHSFVDFPLRTPSNGFIFLLLAAIATARPAAAGPEQNGFRPSPSER